jgi:hypothetical protein
VIGLLRLLLRFTWLTLFVLGAKRAFEILQGGADTLIDRMEAGEDGPLESTLSRLHAALHHRQPAEATGADPLSET